MSGSHLSGPLFVAGVPMIGGGSLMTQGDSYFVDPKKGNDNNTGLSADEAKATIAAGEDALKADQNDVLYYMAGGTTPDKLAGTLTWDKNFTHMVGVAAPVTVANRARIFMTAGVADTPMLNVTATGCSFRNMYWFHGVNQAAALVCVQVTGGRNYFENMHFAGIGDATQNAAGACSLKLDGAEENVFNHCVIGLDTQTTRTQLSSELLVDSLSNRNYFENCLFKAWISNSGHHLVRLADNASIATYLWFKKCSFAVMSDNDATALTEVFDIPSGGATQYIFLEDCTGLGKCTDWDAANGGRLYNAARVTTADGGTAGISKAT